MYSYERGKMSKGINYEFGKLTQYCKSTTLQDKIKIKFNKNIITIMQEC